MSLLAIAEELSKKKHIDAIVAAARSMSGVTATKKEFKSALEIFNDHLKSERQREAVAYLLMLLLFDANGTVARLKRGGTLRASRYQFRSKTLKRVLNAAFEVLPELPLRPDRLQYLRSVQALLVIAPQANLVYRGLVARLRGYQKNGLKTLLVVVNEVFSNDWQPDPSAQSDELTYWGAEEISYAFSYILKIVRDEIGHTEKGWQHVDDKLASPFESIYSRMLVDAAKLNEYREAESLLDGLPYRAVSTKNSLEVSSVDESFEQSVRLGYIQADIQVAIRSVGVVRQLYDAQTNTLPTVAQFVSDAFRAGMGELFTIASEPLERLVFGLVMAEPFFAPITAERYFAEEAAQLVGVAIDSFLPDNEDVRTIRVSENLNIADITKVQRLFSFISAAYNERLKEIEDDNLQNILRIRSVVPVMQREMLLEVLSMIVPRAKAEELLGLLALSESAEHIDLQYKPIIKAGDFYVIAPALLYKSNLSRNIIVGNKLRNELVEEQDPMQAAVVDALREAGFLVEPGFEFDIDDDRETDIFCWFQGHFFVFECKNSYHPCSAHELRTSYEHIKTAETQLNVRLSWLRNLDNQERLLKALSWDVPATSNVHTGIITANRLFNGYRHGAHPIRQAHELINLVKRGVIGRGEQEPLRIWSGEQFSVGDLVDYLEGRNIIGMQLDQLAPSVRTIQFGEASLNFQRYMMDIREMGRRLEGAYLPVAGAVEEA